MSFPEPSDPPTTSSVKRSGGKPSAALAPAGAGHGGHSHGASRDADVRYLRVALGLIVGFMLVEVVVAFASGSLALLPIKPEL